MPNIVFDIETVAAADPAIVQDLVKPPRTLKKAESIAAWEKDERPQAVLDALEKTVFDGAHGRIVCIGYAADDGGVTALCGTEEAEMIGAFFGFIESVTTVRGYNERIDLAVIGHNIAGFDLPFLRKRAIINGIKPPAALAKVFAAKPWDTCIQDTMLIWDQSREAKISLDRLCKALGIKTPKGELDGSKVGEYFKAGRYEEIAAYCEADVIATREAWKRITWK